MGRFELLVGERPLLLPIQAQRVLGLLAVVGSPQTRSSLAGTLWRDAVESRAKANLRNALWRVQRVSGAVLRCTREGVGLDSHVSVDLRESQRCAEQLVYQHAVLAGGQTIQLLDRDLLPTWDEEWLVIDRERQRQLRMHALEVLSDALCRVGRYSEGIAAALAAVSAEPLRESSQRALISAHLGEGNVSEAVRQLEAYRRVLDGEMGIAPSRQLEGIVGAALAGPRP